MFCGDEDSMAADAAAALRCCVHGFGEDNDDSLRHNSLFESNIIERKSCRLNMYCGQATYRARY